MNCLLSALVLASSLAAHSVAHAQVSLLRVSCEGDDVGAEVTLNGKFKGECPVDIQAGSGTVKLRVVKKVDATHERVFEREYRMGDGGMQRAEVVLSGRGDKAVEEIGVGSQEREKVRREAERACGTNGAAMSDGGGGILRHCKTRLEWTQSDNGSDIDWDGAMSYCAGKGGGWRLGTADELMSLFDSTYQLHTACAPFVCQASPKFRFTSGYFWSSDRQGASEAWFVVLAVGSRGALPSKGSYNYRALCVRSS
jgi:hypothetical protein